MTSPKLPVKVNFPLPFVLELSINNMSPPVLVQARPVTTPGITCSEYFLGSIPGPNDFITSSLEIVT